jgi:hypothetical protein
MIDGLITQGEALESKTEVDGFGRKMLRGVEFETWAARCILFLEENLAGSSLTKKAIEVNNKLSTNSYSNYQFLLGAMKAAKDYV